MNTKNHNTVKLPPTIDVDGVTLGEAAYHEPEFPELHVTVTNVSDGIVTFFTNDGVTHTLPKEEFMVLYCQRTQTTISKL